MTRFSASLVSSQLRLVIALSYGGISEKAIGTKLHLVLAGSQKLSDRNWTITFPSADRTRSAIHPALGRCSTSHGGDRVAEGFPSGVDSRANEPQHHAEHAMRRFFCTLSGLTLIASSTLATAAEVRVLSVGSTQIAAKAIAAEFEKQTRNKVTFTIRPPFEIDKELAEKPFDAVILSVPAMNNQDEAGDLAPTSRVGDR